MHIYRNNHCSAGKAATTITRVPIQTHATRRNEGMLDCLLKAGKHLEGEQGKEEKVTRTIIYS